MVLRGYHWRSQSIADKKSGTGRAPDSSDPNSEYEQISQDGKLMSRTTYDELGRQLMREDFAEAGHTHYIKIAKDYYSHHVHVFEWNEYGFYIEVILPLP